MDKVNKKIIVNTTPYETRAATLVNDSLVEISIERPDRERLIGNIYKGKIETIHKGMQSAFINIGLKINAFLNIDDMEKSLIYENDGSNGSNTKNRGRGQSRNRLVKKKIQDLLKVGNDILVQIVKQPIGTKGPRVSTRISLAGRCVVYIPNDKYAGISKKIESEQERRRLREMVIDLTEGEEGVIVRTEGLGLTDKEFKTDIQELRKLWNEINAKQKTISEPTMVYKDLSVAMSIIRDKFNESIDELVVDNDVLYTEIMNYLNAYIPQLRSRVKLHNMDLPIFEKYNLEDELDKLLHRKVWFRGGGYLIIERTEAMFTIDVNSGRFAGKDTQQKSILETNLNAAKEIAKQVILRDIGGMIVLDFIDMRDRKDRKHLHEVLIKHFAHDVAKVKILPPNDFGLIILSRQRIRESIPYAISETCYTCEGYGRVMSRETIAAKIEREIKKYKSQYKDGEIELDVHPHIEIYLNENKMGIWQDVYNLSISLFVNDDLSLNQFEIYGLGVKKWSLISDLFTKEV